MHLTRVGRYRDALAILEQITAESHFENDNEIESIVNLAHGEILEASGLVARARRAFYRSILAARRCWDFRLLAKAHTKYARCYLDSNYSRAVKIVHIALRHATAFGT